MRERPRRHPVWRCHPAADDRGYTLVEVLLAVVILGILTAVVTLLVTGISTEAADTGCDADRRQLYVAFGAYEAQTHRDTIDPVGDVADGDRFERGLVATGFLRGVSAMHDLAADGTVTSEDSRC